MTPAGIPSTWRWVLAALAVVYAMQVASPLRVNTDGVKFLSYAASIADGQGLRGHPVAKSFPPVYPLVVATLDRLGMARASTLVGLQVVCLMLGLWVAAVVLKRWLGLSDRAACAAVALTLLSTFTIKHTLLPLSEMPYLLVSMLTLYWLQPAEGRAVRWRAMAAAVGLMVIAIQTRSVGIALVPAVLWAMIGSSSRRGKWIAVVVCVAAGATFVATAGPRYLAAGQRGYQQIDSVLSLPWLRLIEAGSMLGNVPSRNLATDRVLAALGVAMVGLVALAFRRHRTWTAVDVYVACYALILAVWPFGADVRFWVPVLPLLIGKLLAGLGPLMADRTAWRWGLRAAIAWYVAVGVAAIGYTTRVSFSGRQYAERQGDPIYRNSYRVAYGSSVPVDPALVEADVVAVLRRYDPANAQP